MKSGFIWYDIYEILTAALTCTGCFVLLIPRFLIGHSSNQILADPLDILRLKRLPNPAVLHTVFSLDVELAYTVLDVTCSASRVGIY